MSKIVAINKLHRLRLEIEAETDGLTEEQAYLFIDVCHALGFNDAETHYVVGETFQTIVDAPVPYQVLVTVPTGWLSAPVSQRTEPPATNRGLHLEG